MKTFLKTKAGPIAAGLIGAFFVMMLLEYINSFLYPLPVGLDIMDYEAVRAFTASLPWTAYILVFLGWVLGSFKAGALTTFLSKERRYRLSLTVGIILTLLGALDGWMIGHSLLFSAIALPMFIIFTYLGHRYVRKLLKL